MTWRDKLTFKRSGAKSGFCKIMYSTAFIELTRFGSTAHCIIAATSVQSTLNAKYRIVP